MRKIIFILCISLICVRDTKCEFFFDKNIQNSKAVTNLSFIDSLVSQVISFNQDIVIFITKTHLIFYSLRDNKYLRGQGSTEHGIKNAFREHITSYFTHGYLAFVKKKNLYIYAISASTNEVTSREVYPADFFGISEYTGQYSINPWNSTVVMKTGPHSVHVLDFRSIQKPTAEPLHIINKDQEIKQVSIVDYGKAAAITYTDIIDFISLTSRTPIKSFTFKDKILGSSYHFVTNTLIIITSIENGVSILCRDPYDRIPFILPKPVEPRFNHPSRTGIGVLALLNKNTIEYFNIKGKTPEREIVKIPEEYKGDYVFDKNFRLSNLIQLRRNDTSARTIDYKYIWLRGDAKGFCHSSCAEKCEVPFVPCSQFWWLSLGFAMSTVSVLIVYVSSHILYTCIEKKDVKRGRGNASLSITFTPSKPSRYSNSSKKSSTSIERPNQFNNNITDSAIITGLATELP